MLWSNAHAFPGPAGGLRAYQHVRGENMRVMGHYTCFPLQRQRLCGSAVALVCAALPVIPALRGCVAVLNSSS